MRRRQRIEVRHVLMPFVASLVLAILVLFLYTFLNPPKWKASDQDVGFGQCDDNAWERVALAGLLAVALCITLWEAYKTKHLPEDISDSRRVWHTLLGHAAVLLCKFVFPGCILQTMFLLLIQCTSDLVSWHSWLMARC